MFCKRCILDDTHLFTYQAAWAKFNTLSQNLSFKPNYNQLSWILTMCHRSKVSPFFTVFSNIHPLTLVSFLTCEWQAQYYLYHSAGSVLNWQVSSLRPPDPSHTSWLLLFVNILISEKQLPEWQSVLKFEKFGQNDFHSAHCEYSIELIINRLKW